MIESVRRRAEFVVGAPVVLLQYLAQRIGDGVRDAASAVGRERRNARVVGEMAVHAMQRSRAAGGAGVVATGPDARTSVDARAVASEFAHLGVGELVSAIPAMSPDQRSALLAEERAGRNRSRIVELLEQLGA